MKRVAILGSTGSIGKSALEVIRHLPGEFKVVALSTNSHTDILCQQIKDFRPAFACVRNRDAARALKCIPQTRLFVGEEGLRQMIQEGSIDRILLAISGAGALMPLLAAIDSGKDIALANKEALVMAGPIIMQKVRAVSYTHLTLPTILRV